jgi:hypothetical protein
MEVPPGGGTKTVAADSCHSFNVRMCNIYMFATALVGWLFYCITLTGEYNTGQVQTQGAQGRNQARS